MNPDRSRVTVESFEDLAARIRASPPRLGPVRFVAVDGAAGSGKTTFAGRLARALGGGTVVLHVDDLLDGWSDLSGYWRRFEHGVLAPLRAGVEGGYRRYDWHRGAFVCAVTPLPVPEILLLEGVGSARSAGRGELSLGALVRAPRELRLTRGLARDGEALRAEWLRWMRLEDTHFAEDRTAERVDLLIDGDPAVPHDPAHEYIRLIDCPGG